MIILFDYFAIIIHYHCNYKKKDRGRDYEKKKFKYSSIYCYSG